MALPVARFQPASDQSLLVVLSEEISLDAHRQVAGLLQLLELEPISGVRNLHPAYSSILVVFDGLQLRHAELEKILHGYLERLETIPPPEPRLVKIPVCYDTEFGLDLNDVAASCSLSATQIIEMHCSVLYTVYFLGFVPGFAYLGDVPPELVVSRLATPRRSVPLGSVAIAGRQAGVYPSPTPGGWRILGRTPVAMFCRARTPMSLLSIGDQVRFVPISRGQFDAMEET